MRTISAALVPALLLSGCGSAPAPKPAVEAPAPKPPAKITQFYSSTPVVAKGAQGQLCYGVENASKVELNPPVEEVWPTPTRCFDVDPVAHSKFTLTAIGADGSRDSKTVSLRESGPAPRVFDLWASSLNVRPGEEVKVCFKVQNATEVTAGPGNFSRETNCITDRPSKTTTYKLVALGADGQEDSGSIPVTVK